MSDKKTLRVTVGSKNPVKVNAVTHALTSLFPDRDIECLGLAAPSGVADQPMTSKQTRQGAINRVEYCKAQHDSDYYIAMEGGVDLLEDGPVTFAYIAIDDGSYLSLSRGASLPIPLSVYKALQQGEELGDVMDRLFNTNNVKQKGGAIGLLTNGYATRESNYRQALLQAMAPFLHRDLFFE